MTFLKDFEHRNEKVLYSSSFDEMIKVSWSDYFANFKIKKQHSQKILGNQFASLIKDGFIQESKLMSIASILQMEKHTIPFFIISRNGIDWIQKISLYHSKNDFQESDLRSNKSTRQFFFVNVKFYFLFLKWLIREDLFAINIVHERVYKRIDTSIINFYDFRYTKDWKIDRFQLDHLLKKIKIRNEEELTNSRNYQPFHLQKNISNEKFRFKSFFKDLRINNQLNSINSTLETVHKKFVLKICDLYNFKLIQFENWVHDILLKENQKKEFKEALNLNLELNPRLNSQKRILLILNQSNSDLNPFLFLKDSLLRGFFHYSLVNTWTFGGRYDSIMILEYRMNNYSFDYEKSEFNRFIEHVRKIFPNLEFNIYDVSEEERFLNANAFLPNRMNSSELQNLTYHSTPQEEAFLEIIRYNFTEKIESEENSNLLRKFTANQELTYDEFHILLKSKLIYYPKFFNWKFWQITGYSFSLVLLVDNPGKKKEKFLKYIHQFPIGKVLFLKNQANNSTKLCVFLQFRENITDKWFKLISYLESINLKYIIIPMIPLDVYESSVFVDIFKISNSNINFTLKNGNLLELPILFPGSSRKSIPPEVQVFIFTALKTLFPSGLTNLTNAQWIQVLKELKTLRKKGLLNFEAIKKSIELFK